MEHYLKKNLDYFYILHEDAHNFIENCLKNVLSLANLEKFSFSPQKLTETIEKIDDKILKKDLIDLTESLKQIEKTEEELSAIFKIIETAHGKAHVALSKLGMAPEVENLIKRTVNFTMRTIHKNQRLSELFSTALLEGGNYFSTHSTLIAYISSYIASLLGWESDFTRYKLSLASFLHDILLNESLAKCQVIEDVLIKRDQFTKEQIQLFLSHPEKTADLVREISELPPDVDQIVLQHHERPKETGFPLKLNARHLSPLSCVFIIAHDYVNFIYNEENHSWNIHQFLKHFESEYDTGYFKKISALLKSVKKS